MLEWSEAITENLPISLGRARKDAGGASLPQAGLGQAARATLELQGVPLERSLISLTPQRSPHTCPPLWNFPGTLDTSTQGLVPLAQGKTLAVGN